MKMNAAITALLLPLASISWGQTNVDLVQSQEKAKQIVQTAKQSFKQGSATSPAANAEKERKDSLGSVLSACSAEARAAFLSKLEFRDHKLVTVYDEDTRGCVSEQQMRRVVERISNSTKKPIRGRCGSPGTCHTNSPAWCTDNCESTGPKAPATPAPLFSNCSQEVRNEFFTRLTFRDGELTGMYIGGIKRCGGDKDLDAVLSVFDQGLKGNWIKEHECSSRATCTSAENKACNTKTC